MEFKASLDGVAKMVGLVVSILMIIFTALQIDLLFENKDGMAAVMILLTLFIFFLSIIYRPKSYIITGHELIVKRGLVNVRIPFRNILSVQIIERSYLRGSIRSFGVGGMWGYYGKFINSRFGAMTWYATNRDNPVLIRTKDKEKIIITPDDPALFLEEYNKATARQNSSSDQAYL